MHIEDKPADKQAAPTRYASASIAARRARILTAARQLIEESAGCDFAMAEVSARAGVALKTVYNLVGGKPELLAQAVAHYQQELQERIRLADTASLEAVLASLADICAELAATPGWGHAIASLYFARDADAAMHMRLRQVSRAHLDPCLAWLAGAQLLQPAAPVDAIARQFSSSAYAILAEWSLGRIGDAGLFPNLGFALLTALFPAANSEGRRILDSHAARLAQAL